MFTVGDLDQVFKQSSMDDSAVPMTFMVPSIVAAAQNAGVLSDDFQVRELHGEYGGLAGWRLEVQRFGSRLRLLSPEASPIDRLKPNRGESMRDYAMRVLVWVVQESKAIDAVLADYVKEQAA